MILTLSFTYPLASGEAYFSWPRASLFTSKSKLIYNLTEFEQTLTFPTILKLIVENENCETMQLIHFLHLC